MSHSRNPSVCKVLLQSKVQFKSLPHLETNTDPLLQGAFGEHGLRLGHHSGADHAAISPDQGGLLTEAGHESEELWEVVGENADNALLLTFFVGIERLCGEKFADAEESHREYAESW